MYTGAHLDRIAVWWFGGVAAIALMSPDSPMLCQLLLCTFAEISTLLPPTPDTWIEPEPLQTLKVRFPLTIEERWNSGSAA